MPDQVENKAKIALRPHQKECVEEIVRALADARSGDVRAHVVMAPGTGKTITAAAAPLTADTRSDPGTVD